MCVCVSFFSHGVTRQLLFCYRVHLSFSGMLSSLKVVRYSVHIGGSFWVREEVVGGGQESKVTEA